METSPDPIRNEVEAIKASWKADPCWDLHEFDAAAADLPHLIPFQAELRQFALDTRAAWAAEVKAAHDAKIGAIARRILERNNEEDTVTRGMLAPPGVVRLIRVLAAEINACVRAGFVVLDNGEPRLLKVGRVAHQARRRTMLPAECMVLVNGAVLHGEQIVGYVSRSGAGLGASPVWWSHIGLGKDARLVPSGTHQGTYPDRTTAVRAIFRALKLPVVGDEAPPHYTLHEIDPGDGRPIVFGFMVGEPAGGGPAETILQLDGTARTYESAAERAWDHWLDSSRQEAAC